MKKRAFLLPFISVLFALGSCESSFSPLFNKVEQLNIIDNHNAYIIGDIFKENNELEILATYTDESVSYLTYNNVSITMYCEGISYSPTHAFEVAGEYEITAYVGSIKSNTITIEVYTSHVYASSIDATCSSTSLKTMQETLFEVDVSPSNFTEDIIVESNRETSVIKKVSKTMFYFYEEEKGSTTLTIKIKSSSTNYVSTSLVFSVTPASEKVDIKQTYKTLSTKNCPTEGEVNILVIPVWFTDSGSFFRLSGSKNNIRSDIEKAFFGSESDTGWNSVSSYYKTESREKLDLNGTVSEWYEPEMSVSDIGKDSSEKATKTQKLVNDAVNWYFTTYTEDERTNYDSDGDGYLDGVVVIYGAPDCNSYGVSEEYSKNNNLWAYCYWIESNGQNVQDPNAKTFLWASYDFMYGQTTAYNRTGSNYSKGNTSYCLFDTHTYIHEMGHVLGLADYYDYSAHAYLASGGFSMQDYNVGAHDPFSVMSFGWANPYIPTESCRIKIGAFQETGDLIVLTPSWNEYDSPFDEYLILELFTPTGLNGFDCSHQYVASGSAYPKGTKDVGIRLWHVDARLTYTIDRYYTYTEDLITDASGGQRSLQTAFTNTYIDENVMEPHITPLARTDRKYSYFNILSLIRNDKEATHIYERNEANLFNGSSLFKEGDTFSMQEYGKQFAYKELYGSSKYLLNSGLELGWEFYVESIEGDNAIIRLNRI